MNTRETQVWNGPVIIGAGPCGITAAIQLKRSGLTPLVFEKQHIGGLIHQANLIENYPGLNPGEQGHCFAHRLKTQFMSYDIKIIPEEVCSLEFQAGGFRIITKNRVVCSNTVLIASGTRPKELSGIQINHGCASHMYYDVNAVARDENRKGVIIGGGDAALDNALNLSETHLIRIFVRSQQMRALPLLMKRVQESVNIEVFHEINIVEIEREKDQLNLQCRHSGMDELFKTDYVLVAIGRDPELRFMTPSVSVEMDRLRDEGRLYMEGDVVNGAYRQLAIASGNGMRAAMDIVSRQKQGSGR